jgi:hypothetical protein
MAAIIPAGALAPPGNQENLVGRASVPAVGAQRSGVRTAHQSELFPSIGPEAFGPAINEEMFLMGIFLTLNLEPWIFQNRGGSTISCTLEV